MYFRVGINLYGCKKMMDSDEYFELFESGDLWGQLEQAKKHTHKVNCGYDHRVRVWHEQILPGYLAEFRNTPTTESAMRYSDIAYSNMTQLIKRGAKEGMEYTDTFREVYGYYSYFLNTMNNEIKYE